MNDRYWADNTLFNEFILLFQGAVHCSVGNRTDYVFNLVFLFVHAKAENVSLGNT